MPPLNEIDTIIDTADFAAWFGASSIAVREAIPCDSVTFAELHLDPSTCQARALIDIPDFDAKPLVPAFADTYHEHPIKPEAILDRCTPDVLFTHDFLNSQADLHDTQLYKRVFRVLEIEHQARLVLRIGAHAIYGMGVNRKHRPFTTRDRQQLTRIQHQLTNSYRALQMQHNLKHHADMIVNIRGKILQSHPEAIKLLALLDETRCRSSLPPLIVDWLRNHLEQEETGVVLMGGPPAPLELPHGIRVYAAAHELPGQFLVALRRHPRASRKTLTSQLIRCSAAEGKSLSAREAEVLYLISEGKKNKEIAEILVCSEVAVKRATERLFGKLNVSGRQTARRAAARTASRWLYSRRYEVSNG